MRYDWLTQYEFDKLAEVQDFATQWMFGDAGAALNMPETQPWAGGAGFEPPPPGPRLPRAASRRPRR